MTEALIEGLVQKLVDKHQARINDLEDRVRRLESELRRTNESMSRAWEKTSW